MKILFITKDNPFGVGGANFAGHAYLRAFSEISDGNVDVFMASSVKDDDSICVSNYYKIEDRPIIEKLLSVFTGQMHRYVKPVLNHLKNHNDYDFCVFNNSKVSRGLIKKVMSYGIKTITIHHNCEIEFFDDNTTNILFRLLYRHHVIRTERKAYQLSNYNLFLTRQDIRTFEKKYSNNQKNNYLLGTFEFKSVPELSNRLFDVNHPTFAITGSLCTVQGVDGVKYFFDQLYSYLPRDCKVIISGRSPSQDIKQLCEKHNNVTLVANPEDINSVINLADIYVCPTRLGGGLKLRVMDGLRLGIPVITHKCSARGYDEMENEGIMWSFADQKEFSKAINTLLDRISNNLITKENVRSKYLSYFSYEAGLNRLKSIIN